MKPITFTLGEGVLDIRSMEAMDIEDYLPYVEQYLMYVDHHDVLRAAQGGHPIAVTRQQLDALISQLQSERDKFRDE